MVSFKIDAVETDELKKAIAKELEDKKDIVQVSIAKLIEIQNEEKKEDNADTK